MKKPWIIVLTLAVAAISSALTAWWVSGRETAPQSLAAEAKARQPSIHADARAADEASTRLLEGVLKELAQLRRQVDQLQNQAIEKPSTPAARLDADDGSETSAAPPEEMAKRQEKLIKARREFMDNNLRQEPKDTKWVPTAQAKLSTTYATATDKGVRFVNADCRSTMCRVDMALDQPGKPGEMQLRRLMDRPAPWAGPRFMQLDKQTGEVVMYMMREGHDLPALPQEQTATDTP